ncbi:MAG TPA: hypothetical protein VM261_22220 [Kofleriaceae bacterium]|nr:hypothetical protein [Kofleriaceae bacterium]
MSAAQRTVDGFTFDLLGGTDDVAGDLILVTGGRAPVWTGLDAGFAERFRIEHGRPRSLHERRFVEGGTVRVVEPGGAVTPLARVADLDGGGESARVLLVLDDGMIISRGQRIVRVDPEGRRMWPEVRTLPGIATEACVSGDRLLVATDSLTYTHWGYDGPPCLLRLRDGSFVAELRQQSRRIAALDDDGHFLVTLAGYDVFDTWLHDRDGMELQRWRSSGHLVPDPDGTVRVVEVDSQTPTRARVARLHRDGTIERGPELHDSQCSPPVILDDGRLVFVEGGRVRAIDRALSATYLADLAHVPEESHWLFDAHLARFGARVVVALCERLPEAQQPKGPGRTAGDILYRTHLHALDV